MIFSIRALAATRFRVVSPAHCKPSAPKDCAIYNNSLWTRDWFVGLAARSFGDAAKRTKAFTAARVIEEKRARPTRIRAGLESART